MSLGGKDQAASPSAVNPQQLAAAQTQSNISTAGAQAALNNANTFSPYGSSTWTPTTDANGNTTYSLNQPLSPDMQQLFGGQQSLAQLLAGTEGPQAAGSGYNLTSSGQNLFGQATSMANNIPSGIDYSGVAPIQTLTPDSFRTNVAQGPVQTSLSPSGGIQSSFSPGGAIQGSVGANFPDLVKQAQTAAYGAQTQYLDPQFQQGESDLRQRLADQGISEGSPAFSRAMLDFNNQKQQAYQQAQDSAVAAGNQQEQSLFGQSVQAGEFANAAQQQGYGQALGMGQFTNQAQQQQFAQQFASGQFGNQAQQPLFGQGLQLADLYNQAVQAATGQGNTATQLGMQQAQSQAQQPISALQALLAGGSSMYGSGLQGMQTGSGFVNSAPTWPLSIPTMGGTPTTVAPTNQSDIQRAATGQNTFANSALTSNLGSLGSLAGFASQGNGLFGQGGLFGTGMMTNLFGGGGAGSFMLPGSSAALGGVGELIGSLADLLPLAA